VPREIQPHHGCSRIAGHPTPDSEQRSRSLSHSAHPHQTQRSNDLSWTKPGVRRELLARQLRCGTPGNCVFEIVSSEGPTVSTAIVACDANVSSNLAEHMTLPAQSFRFTSRAAASPYSVFLLVQPFAQSQFLEVHVPTSCTSSPGNTLAPL